jgi:hypothetical protein
LVASFEAQARLAESSFLGCVCTFVVEGCPCKPWCGLYMFASRKHKRLLAFLLRVSPQDATLRSMVFPEKDEESILSLHQVLHAACMQRQAAVTLPFCVTARVFKIRVQTGGAGRHLVCSDVDLGFKFTSATPTRVARPRKPRTMPFGLTLTTTKMTTGASSSSGKRPRSQDRLVFENLGVEETDGETTDSEEELVAEVPVHVIKELEHVTREKLSRELGFVYVNMTRKKATCICSQCPVPGRSIIGNTPKIAYQDAMVSMTTFSPPKVKEMFR